MLKLSMVRFLIFLQSRSITFEKMHGLGFDGASTMSGNRTIYVHCHYHLLQLAAVNATGEHAEVK